MPMQTLAMFVLVALAAGGVIWVFVYPILSGERQAEKRQESVVRSDRPRASPRGRSRPEGAPRAVEETLKELEVRQKKQKNLPLAMRIAQAGLNWTKRQFIIISVGIGACCSSRSSWSAAILVAPAPVSPAGSALRAGCSAS
jgi:tight adherence protein B